LRAAGSVSLNVLVIDIGGSHVKLLATSAAEPRQFDSHEDLTPHELVEHVKRVTADWQYDVISLGYPGETSPDAPKAEPGNLGAGWIGFDFEAAFDRPVRMLNDAVMQALGAYEHGRTLFLGLGTGLGSALIAERVIVPLELGCLKYRDGSTLAELLGRAGLERLGHDEWMRTLTETVDVLRQAVSADEIVLGGGNAGRVDPLPERTRRGGNDDAFTGGIRLWEEWIEPHDRPPADTWRVVR
jgi:polyphosphate glucokinase